MSSSSSRRRFLARLATGGALLGNGLRGRLPAIPAAEARLDPSGVRLEPDVAPIVRLLEETSREKLIEEVAGRIRGGLSYRQVLAALLLAAVRNVQPRPSVGFKFHAVLVVNSCHLASVSSPASDRWLPIFWALDYFKDCQAREALASGWRQGAVDEARVPKAHGASAAFVEAMDRWDEAGADAAAASLARHGGAHPAFELFARYAARDWRSIGHKAIWVANGFRTLDLIGWRHAEPVLRSLAHALLAREGTDPVSGEARADRPWRRNVELAGKIPVEWLGGSTDAGAALDLVRVLREASDASAADAVVDLLSRGISVSSVWDGLFLGAGETLVRRPNIVSLHAVTTANAVRYLFDTSASEATRRILLLQCASFLPLFRGDPIASGPRIEELEPAPSDAAASDDLGGIFEEMSRDRLAAARGILRHLRAGRSAEEFIDAARLLVFRKGRDSHDYKFSSAVLEDYHRVTPAWRDRFLAASAFRLVGAGEPDNGLVPRIRAALGG